MKTIEYYMPLPYRLEILPDPDERLCGRYPDLPRCITIGNSMEIVTEKAEDAKKEWLATAMENGVRIAELVDMAKYSRQFKLCIPKSLHKRLAEHSKEEGVSMNQYCVYLLSKMMH